MFYAVVHNKSSAVAEMARAICKPPSCVIMVLLGATCDK